MKQPQSKHKPARFLGIAWDHGDNLCYHIRITPARKKERPAIIMRSAVRSQRDRDKIEGVADLTPFRVEKDKAPMLNPVKGESNVPPPRIDHINSASSLSSGENQQSNEPPVDAPDLQEASDIECESDLSDAHAESLLKDDIKEVDSAFNDDDEDEASIEDNIEPETVQTVADDIDLEDFQLRSIVVHSMEKGYAHFLVDLDSGEFSPVPFIQLKKDHPLILAKYAIAHDVNEMHKKWAQNLLRQQRISLRRLHFICGADKAFHIKVRRVDRSKPKSARSKNSRNATIKLREKFGMRVPNSIKEALMLDDINRDAK